MKNLFVAILFGFLVSGLASAIDFKDLDAKFMKRGEMDFQELSVLREAYKTAISNASTTDSEKIYGITQMSRLDIFRGGLLPNLKTISLDQQKQAMDSCIDDVKAIKDTNAPQFYYFYLSCIGYRGKLEGMLGRIKYGLMMRKVQEAAEAAANKEDGGFEAGGIFRVMSAIRGNRKAKPLGLYNAAEAVSFAEKALAIPATIYEPFTMELSGEDYFENHYYLAQSMIALGIENDDLNKVLDGNGMLISKIKKIDVLNRINKLGERKPETLAYQKLMMELKGHVEACKQDSDWNTCLSDRLSD